LSLAKEAVECGRKDRLRDTHKMKLTVAYHYSLDNLKNRLKI